MKTKGSVIRMRVRKQKWADMLSSGKRKPGAFIAESEDKLLRMRELSVAETEDGEELIVTARCPDRPMTPREIVGWELMEARIESGLDIEELAERAGINALTLLKIEKE